MRYQFLFKIVSIALVAVMSGALLAACSSSKENSSPGNPNTQQASQTTGDATAPGTAAGNQPETTPVASDPSTDLSIPADGIYEAEEGALTGVEAATVHTGFSGKGYVTGFDNTGDSVEVKVGVKNAGKYNILIRYAAPYGDKNNNVSVNGDMLGSILFKQTNDFTELNIGKALLNAGVNTIKIDKDWGWFEVDYFKIEAAEQNSVAADIPKTLVNPNASREAKALMSYLVDNYGKHILSGQQSNSSGSDLFFIKAKVDKLPAVRGFDFMDYSPSRVEHGTTGKDTEAAIDWWNKGGIVTFCWHWNAPKDLINKEPDKLWWSGFYTKATTFDLEKAMNNEDSEDYKLILRDIDTIAVELKKLQDAKVPVLWRPLHEADGGWFWWGAKGPEPYKKLYKLLYDRLTNYHKLNNLIWVWCAPNADWYPGDEYVDIAGVDIYGPGHNYGPNTNTYDKLVSIVKGKKLVTLSENGVIPDPDKLQQTETKWSWFCTWSGEFISDEKYTEKDQLIKTFNHDYVITLDELPDLKNYPAD